MKNREGNSTSVELYGTAAATAAKPMTEYQRVKMIEKLLENWRATVDREKLVQEAFGNLVVELCDLDDEALKRRMAKVTK